MNHVFKPFIVKSLLSTLMTLLCIARTRKSIWNIFGKFLKEQKLYANLKKCQFFTDILVFLGYVISVDDIKMNDNKVEAILIWPTHFNTDSLVLLGYVISSDGNKMDDNKLEAILSCPTPIMIF